VKLQPFVPGAREASLASKPTRYARDAS